MATARKKKASNVFVWILFGLLFISLAGFGIGSFTGGASRLGAVGDVEITAEEYFRALQDELNAQSQQAGRAISLAELRARGIDQEVLRSLVARAALANEAQNLGISVGDGEIAETIRRIEAFQGLDGNFDREGYELVLAQQGLDPADYEASVREDTARALLQTAVIGGIAPPSLISDAIVAYQGQTRDFELLTITRNDLPGDLPEPTEEELQAFYDDQPERFTLPEARRITYAWITPDMIMDDVQIDEQSLRDLYDDRLSRYSQPERRLLERLAFGSEEAAQAAYDAIIAGETDFDTLVEERGLTLEDVDLGEVAEGDLMPDAAAVIFADTESEILGPLPTSLGPAVFRVNAVLEASQVSFEEAQEELRGELAQEAARRQIDATRDEIDDLLAGGAELEELAESTGMELGTIDVTPASEDGIAGYDAFREAALEVSESDFPELLELSDGGLFAIRLDEIVPPTLPPLEEITEVVADAWEATALRDALADRAQQLVGQLALGARLEDLGPVVEETQIRRQDLLPDLPPTLVAQVFQLDSVGDTVMVPAAEEAYIAALSRINPAARDAPDTSILINILEETLVQSIAVDIFEAYGTALEQRGGIELNQAMINSVHANFP